MNRFLLMVVCCLAIPILGQGPAVTTGTTSKKTDEQNKFSSCVTAKKDQTTPGDDRCDFEASFYFGRVIDTFAGDEYNSYINPNDSNKIRESYIGGIDVNYRIWAKKQSPPVASPAAGGGTSSWRSAFSRRGELWLYGETVHGVRSVDVDCKAHPDTAVCSGKATTDEKFLYVLRNARSLEAFGGARYEFPISTVHDNVPRLFVATQIGFITIAGSGGDVISDDTYLAVGVLETDGPFSNSYFSAGVGRTDLFHHHACPRLKLDGFLSTRISRSDKMRPFFQMTVDSDAGRGADSVQVYFGADVNFRMFAFKF